MIKEWSVELKNSISGNGMLPTNDPFDNSVFYIADGWGSYYTSMKLRKLSIENGKELAVVPIKNMTRCVYINESHIFAVSEKRILKLNRNDLSIEQIYTKNVPQYSSYVNSNDLDTLLLMCRGGEFFCNFNLKTNQKIKKKLRECCGITKIDNSNFLVFSIYDGIFKYNLERNRLEKIISVKEPFPNCVIDKSNNLYIHCGQLIEKTYDTTEYFKPTSKIILHKSLSEQNREEIDTGVVFEGFQLSDNGQLLYLYKDNCFWLYSLNERKMINSFTFPLLNHTLGCGTKILKVFDKEKLVITNEVEIISNDIKNNVLTCWKMQR